MSKLFATKTIHSQMAYPILLTKKVFLRSLKVCFNVEFPKHDNQYDKFSVYVLSNQRIVFPLDRCTCNVSDKQCTHTMMSKLFATKTIHSQMAYPILLTKKVFLRSLVGKMTKKQVSVDQIF
jgi:hypothetical protein